MFEILKDINGIQWGIDRDRAHGVIASYAYLRALDESVQVSSTRDTLVQKLRIIPATGSLDWNSNAVRLLAAKYEEQNEAQFLAMLQKSMQNGQSYLIAIRREANRLGVQDRRRWRDVMQMNLDVVEGTERLLPIVKGVRDTSAITISIIGAVSTAPVVVALAAGSGAFISGYSDAKEHNSIRKGMISGALHLIPIGMKEFKIIKGVAGFAGNHAGVVRVVLSAAVDGANELASGRLVRDENWQVASSKALVSAGVGIGQEMLGDRIASFAGEKLRSNLAILETAKSGSRSNRTPVLIQESIKTAGGEVIKKTASAPIERVFGDQPKPEPLPFQKSNPSCLYLKPAGPVTDKADAFIKHNVLFRMD